MDQAQPQATHASPKQEALRPWRERLARLDRRIETEPPWVAEASALAALRERAASVLQALHDAAGKSLRAPRGEPAPGRAWLEGSVGALVEHDEEGEFAPRKPLATIAQMWRDREALLRLGLWALLDQAFERDAAAGHDGAPFDGLMRRIAGDPATNAAPPVLLPDLPALGMDTQPESPDGAHFFASFFDQRLRPALRNLAEAHPRAGFERWLLPDFDPRVGDARRWGRSWTVAAAACYADWLRGASRDGSVGAMMALIWSDPRVHFKPPWLVVHPRAGAAAGAGTPAVLPTARSPLRVQLRLGLVLAQLLDHQPRRWHEAEAGRREFAVQVVMRRLHQSTTRWWDAAEQRHHNAARYRGWTVEQLYQVACIEWLEPQLATGATHG
jgi:hypothetical protein